MQAASVGGLRRSTMTDLLAITLPIFLIIALGFAAVKMQIVTPEFIQGLGFFVLNFALPALVVHALTSQDFSAAFDLGYVLVYAAGSLIVFAAVFVLFRFVLRRDLAKAAIASLGASAANSGFVGFPIATLALGPIALIALPLCMLVEVILIIPLALGIAEASKGEGQGASAAARAALLRLVQMPLVIAITFGIVLALLGLSLPRPLATAVDMIADASAACALFVVGGTLANVSRQAFAPDLAWIALAKLVLHPLVVALGFAIVGGVDPVLVAAGILFAGAPMMTSYPIFGQRFGLSGLAAAALVVTTVASFVTVTIVLGLLLQNGEEARLTEPGAGRQAHAMVLQEEFDGR